MHIVTEAELAEQKLRLCVQGGLRECVTANLAGLHATEDAQVIKFVAYFCEELTEVDHEYIEEACGLVLAQYSWDYDYTVDFKLISEADIDAIDWFFLRAEADRTAVNSPRHINSEGRGVISGHVMSETSLAIRKLGLCIEGALRGRVTANLPGLYAGIEAKKVTIAACFFEEPTELDRACIEAAARDVSAQYTKDYAVVTEYKLVAEVDMQVVPWEFLRMDAYRFDDDSE